MTADADHPGEPPDHGSAPNTGRGPGGATRFDEYQLNVTDRDRPPRTMEVDANVAIPLPAVRERRSVTVTYPSHPTVNSLFERLGGVLPVADEAAFNVFSALAGTLTTHYAYLATLTSWAVGHGIASDDADSYVRSPFQGVGHALIT